MNSRNRKAKSTLYRSPKSGISPVCGRGRELCERIIGFAKKHTTLSRSSVLCLSRFGFFIFFASSHLFAQSGTVSIQKSDDNKPSVASTSATEQTAKTEFSQLESDSIDFVKKHHPELVSLLQLLKSMKEAEYQAAIREIGKVRKRLETLEGRDHEAHTIELDAWKLQSKIDLLLARAVAQGKEVDADALRKLVKRQLDNQRRRLKHERNLLADRQKQVKESLDRLESNEEERIDQHVVSFIKRVRSKIDKTAKSKGEPNSAREEEKQ